VSVLELVLAVLLVATLICLVGLLLRRPATTAPSDAVLAALTDLGALRNRQQSAECTESVAQHGADGGSGR